MRTSCQDIQNEPDFPYSPFETSGAEKKMFFLIKIKRELSLSLIYAYFNAHT